MGIVTVLVFGVVSLGIACAFVIFILKNLKEYGIIKAMGVTTGEMTLLIVMEVVLMNLLATLMGIIGGILVVLLVEKIGGIDLTAFTSHNRYFAVSGIISPRLTFYSLCLPPLVSFLAGLISAIWPAALVARKRTADILRIV
jgi:ABC-type lipoprotein release transport system permease subunit